MNDKKYQIFISSTFEDLQDERQSVLQALLEMNCIPSGMELFPAANQDQWSLIQSVIADCDYYVVIIGGRYGSLSPTGIGYTEMEFNYATELKKPILGFIHKSPENLPAKKCESTKEGKEKLEAFKSKIKGKMIKHWNASGDLSSVVSRSLINIMRTDPAIGWVRADKLPDKNSLEEILELRKKIDELSDALKAKSCDDSDPSKFAQGDDRFTIEYRIKVNLDEDGFELKYFKSSCQLAWNDIFYGVGPRVVDEASENEIKKSINSTLWDYQIERVKKIKEIKENLYKIISIEITDDDFQTVKIQFMALNLIQKSNKNRSVKDRQTYWTITDRGDRLLVELRAIKKEDAEDSDIETIEG